MTLPLISIAQRSNHVLNPDPSRVLSRLFVAGHDDYGSHESRTSLIIGRILDLSDDVVAGAIEDVHANFDDRHQEFRVLLESHAHRVANRIAPDVALDAQRWRLIGAFG